MLCLVNVSPSVVVVVFSSPERSPYEDKCSSAEVFFQASNSSTTCIRHANKSGTFLCVSTCVQVWRWHVCYKGNRMVRVCYNIHFSYYFFFFLSHSLSLSPLPSLAPLLSPISHLSPLSLLSSLSPSPPLSSLSSPLFIPLLPSSLFPSLLFSFHSPLFPLCRSFP